VCTLVPEVRGFPLRLEGHFLHARGNLGMDANKLGCPSLVLTAFLMVVSGHYAHAQPLGANPSAASSDIGNPSSINPAARASDIGNPSAINPAGAVSQIPRSSAVSPSTPAQAMPRVARQRIAPVQRTQQGRAPATQVEQGRGRAVPSRVSRNGQGTLQAPVNKRPKLSDSEVEGAKARAADEVREKAWDTKTKKSMSGICVGC
jgi:hypothetical protein